MKVLVINCGSSSLKFQLIDTAENSVLAKGLCERIGIDGSNFEYRKGDGEKTSALKEMKDHKDAVALVIAALTDPETGVVSSLKEIDAVGHRTVHGGEKFKQAVRIDEDVIAAIEEVSDLAPLHNPACIIGIRACMDLMPDLPHVAVFDTAFHQTMKPEAYLYAIPYEYYEKYKVRRYGFHGTSHAYVSSRAADMLKKDIKDLKIIVCHLGNGASISAVQGGQCVDTSMGLTPLEGLIMGTRSGDIDPAVIPFIAGKEGISCDAVVDILNKKSGVLGLTGVSSDFRDIVKAAEGGSEISEITLRAYSLRVAKYIGAYAAAMNGVDAIAFTAGVGENDAGIRGRICQYLGFLGTELDEERNKEARGREAVISKDGGKPVLMVIPTNEELSIAMQTVEIVGRA
ncbi:MAG: acetate kinase [Lachnospiraceae bacterium]|nr:acetate kinase [Lachnospiraceae bacterium]